MKTYLLRGVPHSLAIDGWWLSSRTPPPPRPRDHGDDNPGLPLRAGILVGLVVLADFLLWQVVPGLSLAVFGFGLLVTGWAVAGYRGTAGLGLAALLFLPVVERVQALSVAFWLAGLALGAAWIALARWPGLSGGARFLLVALMLSFTSLRDRVHACLPDNRPSRGLALVCAWPGAIIRLVRGNAAEGLPLHLRGFFMGWALPLGFGFLFAALLTSANPLLQHWTDALFDGWSLPAPNLNRLFFWAGAALTAWPFLQLSSMVHRLGLALQVRTPSKAPAIFNLVSIRRSLTLFNAVFAVQTLSDIAVFTGGATLPAGMSYAEYAHRGAYPLLVTALLAGAFALIARPFAHETRALHAALLAWMAQTFLLVISSLIRLESYISVYGLTHLRLAALLWMGVVALGIVLVIVQILRNRSASWLLRRCAILGVGTLYLASFTSFAAIIAQYNLSHDVPNDASYLCGLDRAALPAIRAHERATGDRLCGTQAQALSASTDWREWGFRDWRTARSLQAIETETAE